MAEKPISVNQILVDWLTFSSKVDSIESIQELLGLTGVTWQQMERGRNGYRQRLMFENISILYDGAENMGVCVDITGTGCRAFESFTTRSWQALFQDILDKQDYNVSRLDMAYDDHTGILDIDVLQDDTDDHHYVSAFRKWQVQYGSEGVTIYHGSQRSDMLIRIYDKAAEQGLEGAHWVRVELQMRNDIAYGFVAGAVSRPIGEQFRGVLHNYLRYVVPTADTNMSRWPMTDYWEKLLENVQRISCWSAPGMDYTVWKLADLVVNQWGNAIDCYLSIFGTEDLIRMLGKRSIRRSPKYERLKAEHAAFQRLTAPSEEVTNGSV